MGLRIDDVAPDFRKGSRAAVGAPPMVGPQPEGKLTQSDGKPTLGLEGRLAAGKRPCSRAAVEAC